VAHRLANPDQDAIKLDAINQATTNESMYLQTGEEPPSKLPGRWNRLDVELPIDRELLLTSIVIRTQIAAAGVVPTGPSRTDQRHTHKKTLDSFLAFSF